MTENFPEKLLDLALETIPLSDAGSPGKIGPGQEKNAGLLCAAAIREGLGGIFYRRLREHGNWGKISHELAELLKQIYYGGVQKNLRLLRALSEILAQVNNARIKVVMLQGVSLLDNVYTDIGLRALTDIDLWVLPRDFDSFTGCMQRLGYRPRNQYPQTFIRGETIVDVHTHLFWADRIKARDSLLNLDQEIIFDAAQRLTIEGRDAYRLARTDQFIYLSLHVFKHSAQRLIWLVDLVHLIRDWDSADWIKLRQRAVELGQYRIVKYMLFMLEELADLRLPTDCRDLFRTPSLKAWEKAVLRMRKTRGQLPVWASLVLLPADLSPVRKVRFLFENLFPAPAVLRQVFSQRAHLPNWQLYGLRVLQLMGIVKAD